MSKRQALVTLLLLCAAITPMIQVAVANGQDFTATLIENRGDGGGNRPSPPPRTGGGGPPGRGSGPPRPNPPAISLPTAPGPTISRPTAGPSFTGSRPSFTASFTPSFSRSFTPSVSFSFTRSLFTSFSFDTSAWTGITFTRTYETSYTFNPTFTYTYATTTNWYGWGGYWYPGMGWYQQPVYYNPSTGSFTLDRTLYDQNQNPCLYYDYFVFDAPAGLSATAQVWTSGAQVSYMIVPSSVLSLLTSPNGCSTLGSLGQGQSFGSTPTLLSWTAPQSNQYAIIFYSTTLNGNTVYFIPQ